MQWLKCAKDNEMPIASYVFESKNITLQHQGSDDRVITINTRECMKYLTELADPKDMLKDALLSVQWDLWMQMAFAEEVVDLFDRSTWATHDYEPLLDLVHANIAPHALHQQRCENHVQMAALTASNNVGEGRRSDRAAALSYLMRDFNMKSVTEVKSIRNAHGKSDKIDRVEGRQRIQLFADYCDSFNSRVEHTRATAGEEKCRCLLDFIAGDTNKISRVDLEARKAKYAEGIEKPRKITKAEQNSCGPDITAEMDGGLKIKYILQKYDKEIRAEIECRGIRLSKPYTQLSMTEKKNLLKVDEMKNLVVQLKA